MSRPLFFLVLSVLSVYSVGQAADLFEKPNLAAWCIVPFDSQKRTPEQRAAMGRISAAALRRSARQ